MEKQYDDKGGIDVSCVSGEMATEIEQFGFEQRQA